MSAPGDGNSGGAGMTEADWQALHGGDPSADFSDTLVEVGPDAVKESVDGAQAPSEERKPKLLPVIDMAAWEGQAPPSRQFAWGDWIPLHQTSLLAGDGGVGKSLFMQMLCTASALGLPFMGKETRHLPALYLTTEDDGDELWRRQLAICAAFGVTVGSVLGKLQLVSLCGLPGAAFAISDAAGRMAETERWREVLDAAETMGLRFFGFDCATDLMGGDHSDLHQVAEFVQLLTGLAIRTDGASVILHHTNKAGDEWLGSVAWSNKVRTRLIMKQGDTDADPDARVIENPKANYSAAGGRLDFRWHKGAFIRDEDLPPSMAIDLSATIMASADNELFLACLRQRNKEERAVSEKHSPTYAPTVFDLMPETKGVKKARLVAAMDRLFRIGRIERAELWKGPDRKWVVGLREVAGDGKPQNANALKSFAGDGAGNGAGDVRETVEPIEAGDGAGDAGDTHTIS